MGPRDGVGGGRCPFHLSTLASQCQSPTDSQRLRSNHGNASQPSDRTPAPDPQRLNESDRIPDSRGHPSPPYKSAPETHQISHPFSLHPPCRSISFKVPNFQQFSFLGENLYHVSVGFALFVKELMILVPTFD
ncbi:hypothetical protein CRG98_003172 [Punica granatum]|uniref:Uncharacterized protein n=1 Tax=Punica granatum TaxID=22663 RepID=A0A2I0L6W1_PUNGR|nr:hypothetical protein CRG98_003172 [Punica granatum]